MMLLWSPSCWIKYDTRKATDGIKLELLIKSSTSFPTPTRFSLIMVITVLDNRQFLRSRPYKLICIWGTGYSHYDSLKIIQGSLSVNFFGKKIII